MNDSHGHGTIQFAIAHSPGGRCCRTWFPAA